MSRPTSIWRRSAASIASSSNRCSLVRSVARSSARIARCPGAYERSIASRSAGGRRSEPTISARAGRRGARVAVVIEAKDGSGRPRAASVLPCGAVTTTAPEQPGESFDRALEDLLRAVLTSPGDSELAVRRAAFDAGAHPDRPAAAELPAALAPLVEKVARHAYRITDREVHSLADAGWSEDALLEVILAAAAGAGVACLERGLVIVRMAMEAAGP